ncbi:MAG: sugar phosphate isomerase/epimerase family protein [Pirellulales bacterium]
MKIAVKTRNLQKPLRQALFAAADLGVDGVELDARSEVPYRDFTQTAVRQLRTQLADLKLSVAALSFVTRRGYNVTDELDRRVDATKQVMKLARALGAGIVVNQVGRISEAKDDPDWLLMLEVLRDLGDYGQHAGALLCAETGCEAGPTLRRLLDALPDGALGVAFNPGQLVVNGFDPLEAAPVLAPFVRQAMAVDGVRDRARGRGIEVPIGRGSVDFPALLGALEERDFRGYVTVAPTNADDAQAEASQAVGFLRNL